MNGELPLRDIHLPEGVSGWPPAPGWWLLLVLLIMVSIAIWALRHRRQRLCLRKQAMAELQRIEQAFAEHQDSQRLAGKCSVLLRRAAIGRFPRHEVAGLTGDAWLAFLNRHGKTALFDDEVGATLLQAPYRKDFDGNPQALLNACRSWLQQLPAQGDAV